MDPAIELKEPRQTAAKNAHNIQKFITPGREGHTVIGALARRAWKAANARALRALRAPSARPGAGECAQGPFWAVGHAGGAGGGAGARACAPELWCPRTAASAAGAAGAQLEVWGQRAVRREIGDPARHPVHKS